jgi:hypothetical protein
VKTYEQYIEEITQDVIRDVELKESTSSTIDVFNRYFSVDAPKAVGVEEDGKVLTFLKANKTREKKTGLVEIVKDMDTQERWDIEEKTGVAVTLSPELINDLFVPIEIVDDESEALGMKGFAEIKNLAKYGKSSQKEAFKIKPSDLVEEGKQYTPEELIADVKNNLKNTANGIPEDMGVMIEKFLDSAYSGEEVFVENAVKYEPALTNYVGEILGPIAIVRQNFLTGSWDDVEEFLLKPFNKNVEDLPITFPADKNNPLADSILDEGEANLLISSKAGAGAGAPASITSLIQIVSELDDHLLNPLQKLYKDDLEDLQIMNDSSAKEGPLRLAVKYGIIKEEDKEKILNIIAEKSTDIPEEYRELADKLPVKEETLKNRAYTAGFHILTGVAYMIRDLIMERGTFAEMTKAILNNSSMVQVVFKMKKKGNDLAIREFKIVYPPKYDGKIKINASKAYTSTALKGKYTFKIK